MTLLDVSDLHATVEGKTVLHGVTMTIKEGEVHAIMGPNGSGKSSLALTLLGHPAYAVTKGSMTFLGKPLAGLKPYERARLGMFLSFQNPVAIPGVSIANISRTAYKQVYGEKAMDIKSFRSRITSVMDQLHLGRDFLDRSVNEGFSGGEKKLSEVLQMAVLEPRLAILDEPDSGLDIDALKRIGEVINAQRDTKRSFLLITHYPRLLEYVQPDVVHVFLRGAIVRSGGPDLAQKLEHDGYDAIVSERT